MEKEKYHKILKEIMNPTEIIRLTEELLKKEEKINERDNYDITPLHEACRFDYQSDPNSINYSGSSANLSCKL